MYLLLMLSSDPQLCILHCLLGLCGGFAVSRPCHVSCDAIFHLTAPFWDSQPDSFLVTVQVGRGG